MKILTFRQYVAHRRSDASRRHGVSGAEATRELPESIYTADWRAHVVGSFNDGAPMPTALWRTLDEGLQYRILRSTRALRDNDLTGQLRAAL